MSKTEQQHKEHHDVVSKQLDEKQAERDTDRKAAEAQAKVSTPTPTQREMDLIRSGVKVELADDGSGPDLVEVTDKAPHVVGEKSVAPAATPASYATRTVVAGGPGPSHPVGHGHHAKEDKKESDKK